MAVRGSGHCAINDHPWPAAEGILDEDRLHLSLGYRWFEADRHFSGSQELQIDPADRAVNSSHFLDISIGYAVTPRFGLAVTTPFVRSSRTTRYEHDRRTRRTTHAAGLGDLRLMAYYRLLDSAGGAATDLIVGLGPKLPTGDYAAEDTFLTPEGPVRRPVDQSIQPGDGGLGYAAELLVQWHLHSRLTVYGQGFYLFNPENENGTPTDIDLDMSITDQYLARVGGRMGIRYPRAMEAEVAVRVEGVPSRDLIGDSDGFRRPGCVISIEPGLSWRYGKWIASVSVPVAVYRNRVRATWEYGHGDAAFADFTISSSIGRSF